MSDEDCAKFNGAWLMESHSGDITPWLIYEKVSFVSRQICWAGGYGAGRLKVDQLIQDGTLYGLKESDEWNRFRSIIKLDGTRQPALYSEGAPFAELRNMQVEGTFADGTLRFAFYLGDGSMHSKVEKTISEDGQNMHTNVTFPAGDWGGVAGGECLLSFVHKKQEEVRLTPELVAGWFYGTVILAGTTEEADGAKGQVAVSTSLEGMFPSAQALMSLFAEANRTPENPSTTTIKDVSEHEWIVTEEKPGGKWVFEQKFDMDACTFDIKSSWSDKPIGVWHFKVLSEPLRLQCWNTMQHGSWHPEFLNVLSSISEVQKSLDRVLKAKRDKQG